MNYKKWLNLILKSVGGILLLLLLFLIYEICVVLGSTIAVATLANDRVMVLSESHYLYDDKIKRTLSSRVLAVNEFDGVIYALTNEGYIVYYPNEGILKKYKGNNNGIVNGSNYGYGMFGKMLKWTELANFDDFTPKEKDGFIKMFQARYNSRSVYVPPYFNAQYGEGLIDTNPKYMAYLTNTYEYKIKGDMLYISGNLFEGYGDKSYTVINLSTHQIIQFWTGELNERGARFRDEKKRVYGDKIVFYTSFDQFSLEEREILLELRTEPEKYVKGSAAKK